MIDPPGKVPTEKFDNCGNSLVSRDADGCQSCVDGVRNREVTVSLQLLFSENG